MRYVPDGVNGPAVEEGRQGANCNISAVWLSSCDENLHVVPIREEPYRK